MSNRETFTTGNAQILTDCCEGMRNGARVSVVISGIALEGEVVAIRRMDDGDFQITLQS